MTYVGVLLFLIGVGCQALLFWRGWRWSGWHAYPFFFSYLSYTCLWTIAFLFFPHKHPLYPIVYWDSEIVAAVLRFLVAWEVFRSLFPQGTVKKIAGTALTIVLAFLALGYWLSGPTPGVSPVIDFMRKIALSAGLWIILLLGVARFYRIRIGQNTWGMAIGLFIFVSSEIANFAAFDLAPWFIPVWRFVHPFAYVFMLAVWTWSLWDYSPNPHSEADSSIGPLLLSEWQRQSAALNKTIHKVIQP